MTDLEIRKNGSAWEAVYVAGEFVAQIHHEPGSRDWDIHFREAIPLETYRTRKAALDALENRFTNKKDVWQ